MEKIVKKYRKVIIFQNAATDYRKKFDSIGRPIKEPPAETKLDYAIDRMLIRIDSAIAEKKYNEDYEERKKDIYVEHATTIRKEDKDVILYENGQKQYTAQGEKEVRKRERALTEKLHNEDVEIEPYIATIIPKNLSLAQVEAFRGFVIPEDYEVPEPEEKLTEGKVMVSSGNGISEPEPVDVGISNGINESN